MGICATAAKRHTAPIIAITCGLKLKIRPTIMPKIAPINRDGETIPPDPPEPMVDAVANIFAINKNIKNRSGKKNGESISKFTVLQPRP